MSSEAVSDVLLVILVVALLALADRLIRRFGWPRLLVYLVAIVLSAVAAAVLRLTVRRLA